MKRLTLLTLLCAPLAALAEYHPPLEYGVATTIDFVLYNTDGTLDVDEVDGGAEVTLYCDEAAGATATNDFVDEGTFYSLALTAAELQCERLVVSVGATDTNVIIINTFGNASAAIPTYTANVTEISDDATAATNAESFFDGTGYAGTNNVIPTVTSVTGIATNGITAASIATDAITAAKIATDAIGAAELAADAVAEINTTVDTALSDIHLDHLFAADYDPATPPGSATAWANEMVESDAGVTRFTVNALENGPSGTGASAAAIVDEWEAQSQADPTGFHVNVIEIGGTAQTANDNGADINAILVDTGTTLDTYLTDIQGGTFSSATDSLEAIRDRGDAAWTTGSGTGLTAIATGTAQSATGTTLVLASGETFANDELIGSVVQITGGSAGVGQSRCITDNVGSTDTITVDTWTTTPTGTITYEIAPSLGGTCPLQASSGATSLNVTASGNIGIDWANVENATSSVTLSGTTVGTVTTNTDMRGTDNAATATALATAQTDLDTLTGTDGVTLATSQPNYAPATAAALTTVDGIVDSILVDTAEIGAAGAGLTEAGGTGDQLTALATQASVNTVDSNVDAVLVDTGTTIPALIGTPSTDLAADIAAVLAALGISEPVSVPNFSSDAGDVISWLLALSRNEIQQTSTTKTIRNDADTGNIATCAVSDDGTTFQRSECQ